MAGTNLTRLNVALTLTTAAFNRSAMAAQNSLDKFGKSISNIGQIASRGLQIGLATATAAAAGLAYGVKRSAESIDEMAKSADAMGVSMEFLGGLQYIAKDAGVSMELLQKTLGKLQVRIVEAGNGSKSAQESLAAFGLSAKELAGLTPEQQFYALADASQKLSTSMERNSALVGLLGAEGVTAANKLTAAFEKGSAGVKEAEKSAKSIGIAVSRYDAAKVEEMNDEFEKMSSMTKGVLNNITIAVSPVMTALARMFNNASKDSDGFRSAIEKAMSMLEEVLAMMASVFHGVAIALNETRLGALKLGESILSAVDAGISGAEWIGTKMKQAFDLIKASAEVVFNFVKLGWATIRNAVALTYKTMTDGIASALETTSAWVEKVDYTLAMRMLTMADSVRRSVRVITNESKVYLDRIDREVTNATNKTGIAWSNLFADVETNGSSTVNFLIKKFGEWITSAVNDGKALSDAPWWGEQLKKFIAAAKEQADINAKIKADKAKETKAQEDAANAENARKRAWAEAERKDNEDHNEMLKAQYEFEADMARRAGEEKMRRNQMYFNEYNKFLGNLAALQQSHDKRLRAIGKVAAKAQIVSATAVAAIESIKSFSGYGPWGVAAGYAAAAAAVAAGAVQLANVDRGTIGMGGGGASTTVDSSGDFGGGASRTPTQTLVVQGDYLTPETLARLFAEAKEKGIQIEGVRRA